MTVRVCYHLTIPPSPWAACDALVQEVELLRAHFPGPLNHLYPTTRPGTRIPRLLWGLRHWPRLRRLERSITVHHIYNPDPYPFAILSLLRKPVIYTVSAGVRPADRRHAQRLAAIVRTLVVTTAAEREQLRRWGINNVAVVRPGIDLTRFSSSPPPPGLPPTLLMGSAPWTRDQFRTKGVDALLELARHWPELHLIFLWRGLLYREMQQRVHAAELGERVSVLNTQVEVGSVLSRAHAAVILATEKSLIKSYPHSLLEALAAGRPVIVWAQVPIAQDIRDAAAGITVTSLQASALKAAFQTILADYESYARRARLLSETFSQDGFLEQYAHLYHAAGGAHE